MYEQELNEDYGNLQSSLPRRVRAILDIGCGLAGIDLLLHRHYAGHLEVHLLDRDGLSDLYYGFRNEAAFYNSLSMARAFLTLNGVPHDQISTHNVDQVGFPTGRKFDIVLSLISWGFHYPISTYSEQVRSSLAPGGTVIVDVRRGTAGREELANLLNSEPAVLKSAGKYERLAFRTELKS
jgi:SAM-dependent methyltransferase